MGLGGVFNRVLQWLANEVIVKSLSESPTFQRFAVRSSEQAKQMSKSASQAVRSIAESENVTHLKKEGEAFRQQANDFAAALREEIGAAVRGDQRPPVPPRK